MNANAQLIDYCTACQHAKWWLYVSVYATTFPCLPKLWSKVLLPAVSCHLIVLDVVLILFLYLAKPLLCICTYRGLQVG